jgi:hypothetical protein
MVMASWRLKQLEMFYGGTGIIEQDHRLIEFVKHNNIQRLTIQGDPDVEYFQQRLPDCVVSSKYHSDSFMLAVLKTNLNLNLENFLRNLQPSITAVEPDWLYIAVNKYTVETQQVWPDLTDNYDADLLDAIGRSLYGYRELSRHYLEDRGQYFNFAHPTTNAYYERIRS